MDNGIAAALLDAAIDVVHLMDDTAKQDSGAYRAFQRLEAAIEAAIQAPAASERLSDQPRDDVLDEKSFIEGLGRSMK